MAVVDLVGRKRRNLDLTTTTIRLDPQQDLILSAGSLREDFHKEDLVVVAVERNLDLRTETLDFLKVFLRADFPKEGFLREDFLREDLAVGAVGRNLDPKTGTLDSLRADFRKDSRKNSLRGSRKVEVARDRRRARALAVTEDSPGDSQDSQAAQAVVKRAKSPVAREEHRNSLSDFQDFQYLNNQYSQSQQQLLDAIATPSALMGIRATLLREDVSVVDLELAEVVLLAVSIMTEMQSAWSLLWPVLMPFT